MNFHQSDPSDPSARSASIRAVLFGFFLCLALLHPWAAPLAAEEADRGPLPLRIEAARWPEAEQMFRSDLRWRGGDGASSVDLGGGRVLWLFGDSFVDPSRSGRRRTADLVRNSIAIQTGYDPTSASMAFYWKTKEGRPDAFFTRRGKDWFWPASGIMVGKRLLVFLMVVGTAANELGFEARGWKAVLVPNPHESPDRWRLTYLISPQHRTLIVGAASPVLERGYLNVYATDGRDGAVYLVRWPEPSARAGTLTAPQWWAGEKAGWVRSPAGGEKPRRVIADGQTEFSAEYRPDLRAYLQVQTESLMNPCLAVSTAAALTGPWSRRSCFFTPPEQGVPDLLIYAGKSHPTLRGAGMSFTYVVNTTSEERLLNDMTIYFPAMIRGRIRTEDPDS